MIRGFALDDARLRPVADPLDDPSSVVWFDLLAPTEAEETRLESVIGIDIPTLEEMAEIEDSSRLYREGADIYMTATLPAKVTTGHPTAAPVTFILTGNRLVTVRYETTKAFETFPTRAERIDLGCSDGTTVLLALLDGVIERIADIVEATDREIDGLSHEIFRRGNETERTHDYRAVLQGVGKQGDMLSRLLASLVTLERLVAFLGVVKHKAAGGEDVRGRMKSLTRDIRFLSSHTSFLAQKVSFLLDATLGMISIEQNAIIKIFSVAAVIFLPPTLVASIYGMNFVIMPELNWYYGYPLAIGLMVASAVVSYLVFKTRGWL